jgi:putative metallohydrolase (TIGR04338 family)
MSCQQYELYAAERHAPRGVEFTSVESMQRYVDALRDTWWWQLWYPQVLRVEVGAAPARGRGSCGGHHAHNRAGRVEMHPNHWCELYLMHELAHVLAAARFGSQAHCPYFARVYLELVALVVPWSYLALYHAFTAAGIDFDCDDDRMGQARRMPAVVA